MPYRWLPPDPATPRQMHLQLWAHHSLTRTGFVGFVGATAALALVPMLALLGQMVLWVIMAFFGAAIWAIWAAITRNIRDRSYAEDLILTPEQAHLIHRRGTAASREWRANTHWVSVAVYPKGGPVEDYLTLRGAGREVELGSFLTPDERRALRDDLLRHLADLRGAVSPAAP
ncbi:MAG: DUF2244 domain-containing protein [Rhodobacteraceae bacterium]|nr:DUF2244 domain-containing protein [Paracoccaceae bacterium]